MARRTPWILAALLVVPTPATRAEGTAAPHPLLSIADRDRTLAPDPEKGPEEARRLPPVSLGARTFGATARPPARPVDVDEREVRMEVMRRLQERIQARRQYLDGLGAEPQSVGQVPPGAAAPDPAPRGELQGRLHQALDRARELPPATAPREPVPPAYAAYPPAPAVPAPPAGSSARPEVADALYATEGRSPYQEPPPDAEEGGSWVEEGEVGLPDDSSAFPGAGSRAPVDSPDSHARARGAFEEPLGFVSPDQIRSGQGWALPEELRGEETGLLPPEVTGFSTPPRSRAAAPAAPAAPEVHVLAPGETLWGLARRYGTSVDELLRLNGIGAADNLSVGREIRISGPPVAPRVPVAAAAPVPPPNTHGVYTVKRGDTLFGIARAHGVTVDELLRANPSVRAAHLAPGMELVVASGGVPATARPPTRAAAPASRPAPRPARAPGRPAPRAATNAPLGGGSKPPSGRVPHLIWPIAGTVTSPFGWKDGKPHTGTDIAAPAGSPIRAAAAGRVIYSGTMRGYGNVVILDHLDGFYTVYANNQKNLVQKRGGDAMTRVRQGDVVALVGATGDAVGPQLHFEVRKLNQAVDPLRYLAPSSQARAR